MTRRTKITLFVAVLILIAILLALFLLRYQKATTPPAPQPTTSTPQQPTGALPTFKPTPSAGILADVAGTEPATAPKTPAAAQTLLLLSQSFVERFGSYSNQGGYQNFDEVGVFMTDSMKTWITGYKQDIAQQHADFNTYYGIETKVISTNVTAQDQSSATVLVKTQRQEFTTATGQSRVYYQDIRLELKKVGDEWKVNGAYWL